MLEDWLRPIQPLDDTFQDLPKDLQARTLFFFRQLNKSLDDVRDNAHDNCCGLSLSLAVHLPYMQGRCAARECARNNFHAHTTGR